MFCHEPAVQASLRPRQSLGRRGLPSRTFFGGVSCHIVVRRSASQWKHEMLQGPLQQTPQKKEHHFLSGAAFLLKSPARTMTSRLTCRWVVKARFTSSTVKAASFFSSSA